MPRVPEGHVLPLELRVRPLLRGRWAGPASGGLPIRLRPRGAPAESLAARSLPAQQRGGPRPGPQGPAAHPRGLALRAVRHPQLQEARHVLQVRRRARDPIARCHERERPMVPREARAAGGAAEAAREPSRRYAEAAERRERREREREARARRGARGKRWEGDGADRTTNGDGADAKKRRTEDPTRGGGRRGRSVPPAGAGATTAAAIVHATGRGDASARGRREAAGTTRPAARGDRVDAPGPGLVRVRRTRIRTRLRTRGVTRRARTRRRRTRRRRRVPGRRRGGGDASGRSGGIARGGGRRRAAATAVDGSMAR